MLVIVATDESLPVAIVAANSSEVYRLHLETPSSAVVLATDRIRTGTENESKDRRTVRRGLQRGTESGA